MANLIDGLVNGCT